MINKQMTKKHDHSRAIGLVILSIAAIMTLILLGPHLQPLSFVKFGPITVGGLSENNAMWFGGIMMVFWIVGTCLVAKKN